jgi:hypothetical protein
MRRQIKDGLRARGAGLAWHTHLPWELLGLRAGPKEDSAVSSAELVTGSPLTLPGQLLHVPDPPHVGVPPPPAWSVSYAAAADSQPAHLARAEHIYVCVGGQQKLETGYINSGTGNRITTHPPRPAAPCARPSACQRASTTYVVGILCSGCRLPASSPGQFRAQASRSLCRPHTPAHTGCVQRDKDLHHPGGAEAGGHLCGLPEGPH